MIKINLIETQVPTKIDLPKIKKKHTRPILISIIAISIFLISIFVLIYFVFVRTVEKRIFPPNANTSIKAAKQKEETAIHKKSPMRKSENKSHIKRNKTKKPKQKIDTKQLLKLENGGNAVFSFNIQLQRIPSKNDNVSNIALNNELNSLIDNKTKKLQAKNVKTKQNVKTAKKQQKSLKKKTNIRYIDIAIKTKYPKQLKSLLNRLKIKYKIKRQKIKAAAVTYNIYVGGFDSYRKLVKFVSALKSKGYKIKGIENLGLLFYVCIDKNVDRQKRDSYVSVWKKTPFRIVAKEHQSQSVIYVFRFKTQKAKIKLLKKRGYYPIIRITK